jgi:hypothetical protein
MGSPIGRRRQAARIVKVMARKCVCVRHGMATPRVYRRRMEERLAEVHFSTRLQAQRLFASVTRGEVDFTSALHPSL